MGYSLETSGGSVEINGNTLLNDTQDHLVGGKLFPIAILFMNVAEDMERVRGQRQLAYLYVGFPEMVLTFGFGKPFMFFVSLWEVAAFPYGCGLLAAG